MVKLLLNGQGHYADFNILTRYFMPRYSIVENIMLVWKEIGINEKKNSFKNDMKNIMFIKYYFYLLQESVHDTVTTIFTHTREYINTQ